MGKARVLYVTQEITPYMKDTPMSKIGRYLPQGIQERKKEIRTFMPRYGLINERRNQLHEVIRLSGMNLIISDADHPLIIKVASIQSARMQIYFIDNDDYFHRKYMFADKSGNFYSDNDERMIFYSRGVLETVSKLGWAPDIIHCHGWISSLLPFYVKKVYKDNPLFSDSKIVVSIYNDDFSETLNSGFYKKIKMDGASDKDIAHYKDSNFVNLMKAATHFSDGVIIASETINPELMQHLKDVKIPVLGYQSQEVYIEEYNNFYDGILENKI